jgi:carbamate kinase
MKDSPSVIVYAVGGNALVDPTGKEQRTDVLGGVVKDVMDLVKRGHRIVLTHGNGPQVGSLLEMEETARMSRDASSNGAASTHHAEQGKGLHAWVAATQSMIGQRIALALESEFHLAGMATTCAVLTTRVEVDPTDRAFSMPTKPIGMVLRKENIPDNWSIKQTAVGLRRVVASPRPNRIIEEEVIKTMLTQDGIIICGGGGGIPVVRNDSGIFIGIDAVIDKDRTSGLLAGCLNADGFIISTAVDSIQQNFGTKDAQRIEELHLLEAIQSIEDGTFPEGSMGPKVEAMVRAKRLYPKMIVALCSPGSAIEAIEGRAGTRIVTGWGDLLSN